MQGRQHGRSILFILLFEAIGTFALVTIGVYLNTQSLHMALIFGAFSSVTAPAATVDVLAEYDAKGPLTTSLLAVVGMDDALALLLYSLAAAVRIAPHHLRQVARVERGGGEPLPGRLHIKRAAKAARLMYDHAISDRT